MLSLGLQDRRGKQIPRYLVGMLTIKNNGDQTMNESMHGTIHLVFQRGRGQKRRPNKDQVEPISSFGNKLASTGRISLFR